MLTLAEQPMSKSDKSAWESSTNEDDGLAYINQVLGTVEHFHASDQRLLVRKLADQWGHGVI